MAQNSLPYTTRFNKKLLAISYEQSHQQHFKNNLSAIKMIPGEIITQPGTIELNTGREILAIEVSNTGDRPIQIGSHFHFYEVNTALEFAREVTKGMRLDIPAGTAVRFEPGDAKTINLVAIAGSREIYGFNGLVDGKLD